MNQSGFDNDVFHKVLGQLDDIFELPVARTPNAFFVGAMFTPDKIGLTGHSNRPTGVGGRGRTRDQALASCLGEAAELMSYLERPCDPLLASFEPTMLPNPKALEWAQRGIGASVDPDWTKLDWITAHSLNGGDDILFPFELVIRRQDGRAAGNRVAESNGLGAHTAPKRAMLSGLMEVIERDAIALWWYGGSSSRIIEEPELEAIGLRAVATDVRTENERDWWLLDITTDLGIPAAVCLSAKEDGTEVIAGFGAGLTLAAAAESAFLEMCQMEFAQEQAIARSTQNPAKELKNIDNAWLDRHKNLSLSNYPRLKQPSPIPQEKPKVRLHSVTDVVSQLARNDFAVHWCNLSREDIAMPVVRVLVPGLQSAKIDWQTPRLKTEALRNGVDLAAAANQTSPI